MYKINGTANINAIRAAAEEGIIYFTVYYYLKTAQMDCLGSTTGPLC
jgi:hypothetical protein